MAQTKTQVNAQLSDEEIQQLNQAKLKVEPDDKGEKSVRSVLMYGVKKILESA